MVSPYGSNELAIHGFPFRVYICAFLLHSYGLSGSAGKYRVIDAVIVDDEPTSTFRHRRAPDGRAPWLRDFDQADRQW